MKNTRLKSAINRRTITKMHPGQDLTGKLEAIMFPTNKITTNEDGYPVIKNTRSHSKINS